MNNCHLSRNISHNLQSKESLLPHGYFILSYCKVQSNNLSEKRNNVFGCYGPTVLYTKGHQGQHYFPDQSVSVKVL